MDEKQLHELRHDVRGCLNAIRLSLEVLKMPASADEFPTFIECIETEVSRADELLKQLTSQPASRVEAA